MNNEALLPGHLRRAFCAWLAAATLEYLLVPAANRDLFGLAALRSMSLSRVLLVTAALFLVHCLLERAVRSRQSEPAARALRYPALFLFAAYAAFALTASFTWGMLGGCALLLVLLTVYAIRGWDTSPEPEPETEKPRAVWAWMTAGMTLAFFTIISLWTIARVRSLESPTYDFGIFSQMFNSMRRTGAPLTTLERDGLLSHFRVHVSPIYYLMLPFYCLIPRPETLQVLQAAVMASAVIPLWKLGGLHGLTGPRRFLLCALLLSAPAFSGGAAFDLHENCFLSPLLLWLLWGLDRGNRPVTLLAAALTLCVKEDAAVYVAVVGLYAVLRAALRPMRRRQLWTGLALLGGAVIWFLLVTGWLARSGDGVMVERYTNLIYDRTSGLAAVIEAVLLCPAKALYECFDGDRLPYIAFTMGAMLGLPLCTRRYERFVLLIPWVLVNLLPGYLYQHQLFYQYSFGSLACLVYLCCVNLAPRPAGQKAEAGKRFPLLRAALLLAVGISLGCTAVQVGPVCLGSLQRGVYTAEHTAQIRAVLEKIPAEASVTASTFYTVPLSARAEIYDLGYTELSHLLNSDYIVASETQDMDRFATPGANDGAERLQELLTENGYRVFETLPGVLRVYAR